MTLKLNQIESKEGTKYVRMVVDVWFNEDTESIHLTHGDIIHTTVNNKEGSKRKHENLYKKLSKILKQYGKYPEK